MYQIKFGCWLFLCLLTLLAGLSERGYVFYREPNSINLASFLFSLGIFALLVIIKPND